ncbi:MAG: dihydrofolate reductase [Acidiferrobacter sp.]
MTVIIIAAVARNRVIGRGNRLPWRLPDDLQRFRALTLGHTLVMGRKTYESLPAPLAGRHCLVLSRDPDFALSAKDGTVVRSLAELPHSDPRADLFIAGGAELYAQTLPMATRLYLTEVEADVDGDAHFPALTDTDWTEIAREEHPADDRHAFAFRFRTLVR